MNCNNCQNNGLSFFRFLLGNKLNCNSCGRSYSLKTSKSNFAWGIVGSAPGIIFLMSLVYFESVHAPFIVLTLLVSIVVGIRYYEFKTQELIEVGDKSKLISFIKTVISPIYVLAIIALMVYGFLKIKGYI